MDQVTALYLNKLKEARRLAFSGQTEQALQICWDLRLKVDLSLYLRADVNLLIACILQEPKREQFAKECIDLLDVVKQDFADVNEPQTFKHIEALEKKATEIISRCQKQAAQEPAQDTEKSAVDDEAQGSGSRV